MLFGNRVVIVIVRFIMLTAITYLNLLGRVIPLLEQDAYLASLREEYTHYTNILPILVDNPAVETPILGQFWASKLDSGAGNDSENFVYKLDESTGLPSDGEDQGSEHRNFLAFSSTSLYSINTSGVLTRLANIGDDHEVAFVSPETLGTIDLDIDGYHDHSIVDMAIDRFDRIWVLIYEQVTAGGGGFALAPSGISPVKQFLQGHRFPPEDVKSFFALMISSISPTIILVTIISVRAFIPLFLEVKPNSAFVTSG